MPNLVEVTYEQTGQSKSTNEFGMRDIQQKHYKMTYFSIKSILRVIVLKSVKDS